MASKVKFERIYKLAKGLDTYARDTMLETDETVTGLNVIGTGKNAIKKRKGTALVCTVATAGAVDGLGTWIGSSGRQLLAMVGGTLYRVDSGTAVAVSAAPASAGTFTSGYSTDFCQGGANTYISNGIDDMRYYDGTTVRIRSNGVVAKYMIYYKNCLYAIGNSSFPSRVYRSGADTFIGDFTNSTANPLATSVNISNLDGQDVMSLFKHQDYLYVSKNRSTYRISVAADSTGTISYELVDPAKGSDSHKATDVVENDIYVYNEYGVHAIGYEPNFLDQVRTKILSLRVDDQIQSIEKSVLEDTCAMYFDNAYHFSYKTGGAAANDAMLVYDRQRTGWWKYDIGASCFCEYKNSDGESSLYFGSPTEAKIYKFDGSVRSDAGDAIHALWVSPKYTLKDYTQSKFFLVVVLYVGLIPGTFTVTVLVDGEVINVKTVTIGSTGFSGLGIEMIGVPMVGVEGGEAIVDDGGSGVVKMPVNKMGRSVQVKVDQSSATGSYELDAIDIGYVPVNKLYQPNAE